jgi:segregation and condensation protein B
LGTTKQFLDDLGLRALDELPALGAAEMSEALQSLTLEAAASLSTVATLPIQEAYSEAEQLEVNDPDSMQLDLANQSEPEQNTNPSNLESK